MRELITKSNEWYDNLPELNRFLFFVVVLIGVIQSALYVCMYIISPINSIFVFPIWATLMFLWRGGYFFIKWREWCIKQKNK